MTSTGDGPDGPMEMEAFASFLIDSVACKEGVGTGGMTAADGAVSMDTQAFTASSLTDSVT